MWALGKESLAGITYAKSYQRKCFESTKLRPGYTDSAYYAGGRAMAAHIT